jgi:hypothetical protein
MIVGCPATRVFVGATNVYVVSENPDGQHAGSLPVFGSITRTDGWLSFVSPPRTGSRASSC